MTTNKELDAHPILTCIIVPSDGPRGKSSKSTDKVGPKNTDPNCKHAVTKTYPGECGNSVPPCFNPVCIAVDKAKESGGKLPSIDRNISHAGLCKDVSEYSEMVRSNGPILHIAGRLTTTGDGSKGIDDAEAFTEGGESSKIVCTGCVAADVDTTTLSNYPKGYETRGTGVVTKNSGTGRGLCVGKTV